MRFKTVLFDLDGTLLPMDLNVFVSLYFKNLAIALSPYGYEPQKFVDNMWASVAAMIKNDGNRTNEQVFWDNFVKLNSKNVLKDMPVFDAFYKNDFIKAKAACGFSNQAAVVVRALRENGVRLVLATNPVFPAVATEQRIEWAGLEKTDFELVTTYENSCYSKPNPDYYAEILKKLDEKAENCLMVGNDVDEDMVAENLGMKVFLLTDCLINKNKRDISHYPQGSFQDLKAFLDI